MLHGTKSARLSKALASAATVVIVTAFDLTYVAKICQYNHPDFYTVCDQDSHDITFLALQRSQAEFFSGSDDPFGLSTNSASLV